MLYVLINKDGKFYAGTKLKEGDTYFACLGYRLDQAQEYKNLKIAQRAREKLHKEVINKDFEVARLLDCV